MEKKEDGFFLLSILNDEKPNEEWKRGNLVESFETTGGSSPPKIHNTTVVTGVRRSSRLKKIK